MTNKDILHQVLKGMDPYISCGVPTPIWELAKLLTQEVYGDVGIQLLKQFHSEYDDAVNILYTIDGWDDPNTHVGPEELIAKLEGIT